MADVIWLKRTNGEAVVKVVAYGSDSTYINLADMINTDVEAVNTSAGGYQVNIIHASWSAINGANIFVERDGYRVLATAASSSGEINYYAAGTIDKNGNDQSIYVEFSDAGQITLKLRKAAGWKATTEYALYGAYDDETKVGPLDIPGAPPPYGLFDLPAPGSGMYETTLSVDTSVSGTPYPPGGEISVLSNATAGLYRVKYIGNFAANVGDEIDVTFCQDNPNYFGQQDIYVGFGQQDLATENYYTLEWTGYFKPPATGNYNFWAKSDDDLYMWIGPNAVSGYESSVNKVVFSSNNTQQTADSLYLEADKYYPVRLEFGEWGGSEHAQIFWAKEGDDYAWAATEQAVWFHDSVNPRAL